MTLTDFEQEELGYQISYREMEEGDSLCESPGKSRYTTERRYSRNQRGSRPANGMSRRRQKRHGL